MSAIANADVAPSASQGNRDSLPEISPKTADRASGQVTRERRPTSARRTLPRPSPPKLLSPMEMSESGTSTKIGQRTANRTRPRLDQLWSTRTWFNPLLTLRRLLVKLPVTSPKERSRYKNGRQPMRQSQMEQESRRICQRRRASPASGRGKQPATPHTRSRTETPPREWRASYRKCQRSGSRCSSRSRAFESPCKKCRRNTTTTCLLSEISSRGPRPAKTTPNYSTEICWASSTPSSRNWANGSRPTRSVHLPRAGRGQY